MLLKIIPHAKLITPYAARLRTLLYLKPSYNRRACLLWAYMTTRKHGRGITWGIAVYFKYDAPADGILWRRSIKGTGKLSGQLSEQSATRALTKRVELLGRHAGIEGLSAHDCRHYDATYEARNGTPLDRLIDKFGWNSPAMAMRYVDAAHIANAGTARVKQQLSHQ